MELIVVSDYRLKIILTQVDMQNFGLDTVQGTGESPATRRALRRLFDEVKRRCGFDATQEKTLVQLWQSQDGGCEIFVTRPQEGAQNGGGEYKKIVYTFDRLSHLLSVCHALSHMDYPHEAEVWRGRGRHWHMVLEGAEGEKLGSLSFIEEFGTREKGAYLALLSEHGRYVCDTDGVRRLGAI